MQRLDSHATFAGPGASRPSKRAVFPQILTSSAVNQLRSSFTARSGMEEAILETVLAWDESRVFMASAGVAPSVVDGRGIAIRGRNVNARVEEKQVAMSKAAIMVWTLLVGPLMVVFQSSVVLALSL